MVWGTIQYELFKYGLKSVTSAEASTAYLKAAKQEAQSQGYYEKIQYQHGDFIELATQINPADIVTLDRVICCYHNMKDLVKLSSSKSKKLYAVVYPRDIWWVKLILRISNLFLWLVRNPFRIFAHPSKEINSLIVSDGFTRNFYTKSGIWQIVIYKRQMQRENLQ